MEINGLRVAVHNKPYKAISSLRPELSQAGKTVLVVGGSTGIGHAIARNFCEAGAARVIILGRRQDVLETSAAKLAKAHPQTQVLSRVCDMTSRDDTSSLWDEFEKDSLKIDVMVLNAVGIPALQPILVQGCDRLWEDFKSNIYAPLYYVERFQQQPHHNAAKICLFVSTQDIHRWDSATQMPGYQLTKNACTCLLQQIARDTPEDELRIISFHPSIVFTTAAENAGYTKDTLPWTDENLPGGFAVWAASPEAKFLHGRFVWCTWDVNDLASGKLREAIDKDPWLLKVGVRGL